MKFQNIYSLFRAQAAKYRGAAIFYTRDGDGWKSQNWEDFEEKAHDFACALLAKGLTKGASVAILAGNVPEWTICDVGTIAAGGVGVGIYPTNSAEQCEFIINHSDAEFVFVDTKAQLEKIRQIRAELPKVREVICLEDDESVTSLRDFLQFGRQNREKFLPEVEQIGFKTDAEETAIMVYTSGTTGNPKGARLSHQYILNSCESLRQAVPLFDTDTSFSYLPGCHVAERISGIYNRLYNGASVYFVEDLSKLYAYMLEVKPTVFGSLPRFFEKIFAKIVSEHGNDVDSQTLKDAFGGRVRLLTSGGAPLPDEIADFYARAGVPILQAYGLTENICVAFNTVENLKFGTVGRPMPMCAVRIAADGEILVKSPMMFSGYYKEPEKTAEMFDDEGWLKTGDLGKLDEDGFLKITGRKKEIIVLSTGKNVAPALIENLVKENHLISQCFVFGDRRSYCVALVTLNQIEAESYARANAVEFESFAGLMQNALIQKIIGETIEKANARISSSEQIKKFKILERDFSQEAGEITPTLKLKRNIIAEKFADTLQSLYKRTEN
ncbi:MAG TPA: AMP-dependent synthetase/ligase [Pyrinomonadaceae bacterium]